MEFWKWPDGSGVTEKKGEEADEEERKKDS